MTELRETIEQLHGKPLEGNHRDKALRAFEQLRSMLGEGRVRAAEFKDGQWRPNTWVKQGILLGFRLGVLEQIQGENPFSFFDKNTLPLKRLSIENDVRLVPGGSAIREGAFVAKGVICMPPMYINIGAYVDEGTMIDSHALVGSCAQVGKRVHLSAGAQVGGVLEPVGALPVIIEDDVLVGGNCGVYEGTVVRKSAVLGAGVILAGGTAVYDIVKETVYRKSGTTPLTIPEGAVVIPGSRRLQGQWATDHGLSVATPLVIKYRDGKTDLSALLEDVLR